MVRAAVRPRKRPDESRARAGSTFMSELFDLSGQVAIVTGTSRGRGQYFARALAIGGADLVVTSRKRESLAGFESEMQALGRRTVSLELDVRDEKSIERMAS